MWKSLTVFVFIVFFGTTAHSQVLISLLLGDKLNSDKIEFGLDGGLNWLKIFGYPDAEEFKISFIDSNTGWIIGKKMDSEHHYFVTTKDGGNSWVDLPSIYYEYHGTAYYRKLIKRRFITHGI